MLKMKFFWLIFRGKFEQKTQKSIFLKNQWRLKNIKKAMVVKNIIAEDMPFTKSIFEQFWRSYCKKTIFVVFHFLKFLPIYIMMKCLSVCVSRKIITSSWEFPVTTWTTHNHPLQLRVSFDGSRLVFHGSISVFIGFQWFRLVLMVFHGSRLDFHGSRSVFMV